MCHFICNMNPPCVFGFAGVHLQPEDLSELPAAVALHPRHFITACLGWHSHSNCNDTSINYRHICLHLSFYTYWVGDYFGKFTGFIMFVLLLFPFSLTADGHVSH